MTNHLKQHDITKESGAKRLKSSDNSTSQNNVVCLDTNEAEEEKSSHAKDGDTELLALYKAHQKIKEKCDQKIVIIKISRMRLIFFKYFFKTISIRRNFIFNIN